VQITSGPGALNKIGFPFGCGAAPNPLLLLKLRKTLATRRRIRPDVCVGRNSRQMVSGSFSEEWPGQFPRCVCFHKTQGRVLVPERCPAEAPYTLGPTWTLPWIPQPAQPSSSRGRPCARRTCVLSARAFLQTELIEGLFNKLLSDDAKARVLCAATRRSLRTGPSTTARLRVRTALKGN
jgi:hypothetical protein